MSDVPPAPAVLHGKKTVVLDITLKLFYHFLSTYHACRPHWRLPFCTTFSDLNLAWGYGHKVSSEQNLLASFSRSLFYWSRSNWIGPWINSSWTTWLWVRFDETRKITAVLLTTSKKLQRWRAFGRLWIDLVYTWYDDRHSRTQYFSTSLLYLYLELRSQECKKARTFAAIISQFFQSTWLEFGKLLRLVGVMNGILISYCTALSIFKGENWQCDFVLSKIK